MELAFLVYICSVLEPITHSLIGFSSLMVVSIVIFGFIFGIHVCDSPSTWALNKEEAQVAKDNWEKRKVAAKKVLIGSICLFFASSTIATLVPKEKTAYIMLGAYATQKVAEDPRTQEIGNKILKIVNVKLDQYVTDLTEKVSR